MAKAEKSENVPKAMQEKFDRIVAISDAFCQECLNQEYAQLIRYATAALCRKRPSPLASGRDKTWACGITHAIGMINFLYDRSQDPQISAADLYKWFGVSSSTGQAKSKLVRDTLKMSPFDPTWSLPKILAKHPLMRLMGEARSTEVLELVNFEDLLSILMQEDFLGDDDDDDDKDEDEADSDDPDDDPDSNDPLDSEDREELALSRSSKRSRKPSRPSAPKRSKPVQTASPQALFKLDVFIIHGPVTEAFAAKNPVMARTLEIQGSSTLQDLHQLIFQAFDRWEEHMYEFTVGGKGPQDPNARRYGLKEMVLPPIFGNDLGLTGDVATTTIASLGLNVGEPFGYCFDFGDNWLHQINVLDIIDPAPPGTYPQITHREGKSPPQYADFD